MATKKTTTRAAKTPRVKKEKTDLQKFTSLVKQIQKLERGETNTKRAARLKTALVRAQAAMAKVEARIEKIEAKMAALDSSPENIADMRSEALTIAKRLGL